MKQTKKSETLGVLNIFKGTLLFLGWLFPRQKYSEFNDALGATYIALRKAINILLKTKICD